jgi:hypothetical protein
MQVLQTFNMYRKLRNDKVNQVNQFYFGRVPVTFFKRYFLLYYTLDEFRFLNVFTLNNEFAKFIFSKRKQTNCFVGAKTNKQKNTDLSDRVLEFDTPELSLLK